MINFEYCKTCDAGPAACDRCEGKVAETIQPHSLATRVSGKRDDRIERSLGLLTAIDFNEDDYEDVIAGVLQAIDILQEPTMAPVEVDGKECPPVLVE